MYKELVCIIERIDDDENFCQCYKLIQNRICDSLSTFTVIRRCDHGEVQTGYNSKSRHLRQMFWLNNRKGPTFDPIPVVQTTTEWCNCCSSSNGSLVLFEVTN